MNYCIRDLFIPILLKDLSKIGREVLILICSFSHFYFNFQTIYLILTAIAEGNVMSVIQ